jgi:YfiH family protein
MEASRESYSFNCDALVTRVPGVALGVQVADCVPVFLVETGHRAVGMAHAGWKGLAAGIVSQAVSRLLEVSEGGAEEITALIGPAIGPCCFEVKEDVAGQFDRKYRSGSEEDGMSLDLEKIAFDQLVSAGVPKPRIFSSDLCTRCEEELFYSYRRGEEKGRMLGVVGIKEKS